MSKGIEKVVFFSVFPNTPETITEEIVEIIETDLGPTKRQKMADAFKQKVTEYQMKLKRLGGAAKKIATKQFRSSPSNQGKDAKNDIEEQDEEVDGVEKMRTIFEGTSTNEDPGAENLEHYKGHDLFQQVMKTTVSNYPREVLTSSQSAETVSSEAGSFAAYNPPVTNLLVPVLIGVQEQKDIVHQYVETTQIQDIAESSAQADSPMDADCDSGPMDTKSTADDEVQLGESQSCDNFQEKVGADESETNPEKSTSPATAAADSFFDKRHPDLAQPGVSQPEPHEEINLPKDTNGGMSVVFEDGYLYIIGAILNRISTRCCFRRKVYPEGESDTWEKLPDLPRRCPFHASVVNKGIIHVTGGRSLNGSSYTHLKTYYMLDIKYPGNWKPQIEILIPVQKHNAIMFGDLLTIVGGHGYDPKFGIGVLDNVQQFVRKDVFEEDLSRWEWRTNMNHPRHSCATVAKDDNLYVVGGIGSNGEYLNCAERMTLTDKKQFWEELKNLPEQISSEHSRPIGFIHNDWICILGGQPYCLKITPQKKEKKQSTSASASDSGVIEPIPDRQWEIPSEFPLPILNLSRRSAVIVTIKQKPSKA